MKKNYAAGINTLKRNGFIRQHVNTWMTGGGIGCFPVLVH